MCPLSRPSISSTGHVHSDESRCRALETAGLLEHKDQRLDAERIYKRSLFTPISLMESLCSRSSKCWLLFPMFTIIISLSLTHTHTHTDTHTTSCRLHLILCCLHGNQTVLESYWLDTLSLSCRFFLSPSLDLCHAISFPFIAMPSEKLTSKHESKRGFRWMTVEQRQLPKLAKAICYENGALNWNSTEINK